MTRSGTMSARRISRIGAFAAAVSVAFALGIPAAYAHKHPTPADLVGPAVVYIESGYDVEVTLVEHNPNDGSITFIRNKKPIVQFRGSGFAVEQSAVIVTAPEAVKLSETDAKNRAVNEVFKAVYGPSTTYQLPSD